jgi:tetratricopeptide (TPR) repeat protein
MNSTCRLLCLLLMVSLAQPLWAQSSAPKGQQNSLPSDKTPEQVLALVALNFGVREFHDGAREKAIHYFTEAKRLDPNLLNARLYLATAYASQYIPAGSSEANQKNGETAIAEFREVLTLDPENLSATDGLGSIRFQMAGTPFNRELFLESKSYFQKHIQLKSEDVEPHYWIGVIDWTLAYRANGELRARLDHDAGKQAGDVGPLPPDIREEYSRECGAMVEEGIESMKKALSLRSDYDDAMAYLNLLYRRKADMVEIQADRDQLIKMADDLVDKVKEIKTKRAEHLAQPEVKHQN